jgi:hypothetical protein
LSHRKLRSRRSGADAPGDCPTEPPGRIPSSDAGAAPAA